MSDRRQVCDFCFRPATRTLVEHRRGIARALAKAQRRRVAVCGTARCERNAAQYLAGRVGPLR
jgi:hypothetical protein